MAKYAYTQHIVNPINGTDSIKALGGNPLRRSVVIASVIAGLGRVHKGASIVTTDAYVTFFTPGTIVLPYRDYGSLITDELWIGHSIANATISVTEIFELPRGR